MDIVSKIKLENNIVICLNIKDDKLQYELEYDESIYDEEPYDKFNVYRKKYDETQIRYKNVYYEKVKHSPILKNTPLKEGFYLFIFNKTKLFIEFLNNKISYEMEDIGVETEIDLS
jgi:hypothetical protein